MTKTTNYNLNQWDADDRVTRADFNADNAAIDAALATVAAVAGGAAKIAYGTYTGTGSVGSGKNATTLTFDFAPRLLVVQRCSGAGVVSTASNDTSMTTMVALRPLSAFYHPSNQSIFLTWTDSSVSWYSPNNAGYQFNLLGTDYAFLALG